MQEKLYPIPVDSVDAIVQEMVGAYPQLQKPAERATTKLRSGTLRWDEEQLTWRCDATGSHMRPYTVGFETCTCPSFEQDDYTVQTTTRKITYCKHKLALLIMRKYMAKTVADADVVENGVEYLVIDDQRAPICNVKRHPTFGWQPETEYDLKLWLDDHFEIEPTLDPSAYFFHLLSMGTPPDDAADAVDSYVTELAEKGKVPA